MVAIEWGKLLEGAKNVPSFDPIPEGNYDVLITKCEVQPTSKGEVMFRYQATVQSGPHAKRILFGNLVIPSPTAEKFDQRSAFLLRDMKALGFATEYLATNPQPGDMAAAMLNRGFTAKVTIREYQGKTSNDISRILPAGAGGGGLFGAVATAPVMAPPAAAPTAAPVAPAPAATPAPAPAVAPAAVAPVTPPPPAPPAVTEAPPSLPPSPFE